MSHVLPTARLRARHRADKRFVWYGRVALTFALLMLALLVGMLVIRGASGFLRAEAMLPVRFDLARVDMHDAAEAARRSPLRFVRLAEDALQAHVQGISPPPGTREMYGLLPGLAVGDALRDALLKHPEWAGGTHEVWVPVAAALDQALKRGTLDAAPSPASALTPAQRAIGRTLAAEGRLRETWNTRFLTTGDSREPEEAGFGGAVTGSLLTVLICMAAAFPLSVMTAVYLQEFAPPGRLVDIIEVNINNLAAVPSIVYGLLGLGVYINVMGIPRSSTLVAGLTLALMAMPVIIIATRLALGSVPDSIRQAALALGASPLQVAWHHTLRLSLPGIMTGTILAIARVLGETAPLLLIGMVAFVADVPRGALDPATAMPVQIFLWAASPETGFAEKTAAGILVL
ncbi:MAG: phosphate ABC transporter permease PstA, partial [Alphaproteobacteria bacterium]|nr:phosphate ABC transporter permease PstA [Alphaproteobacteria bacterium]